LSFIDSDGASRVAGGRIEESDGPAEESHGQPVAARVGPVVMIKPVRSRFIPKACHNEA
jgi:hypothetical protein